MASMLMQFLIFCTSNPFLQAKYYGENICKTYKQVEKEVSFS